MKKSAWKFIVIHHEVINEETGKTESVIVAQDTIMATNREQALVKIGSLLDVEVVELHLDELEILVSPF